MKRRLRYAFITLALTSLAAGTNGETAVDTTGMEQVAAPGAPVLLDSDTLFFVGSRILSFSPQERAEAISRKLSRMADDPLVDTAQIIVQEGEAGSEIVCGDVILMTITDRDAALIGASREEVAAQISARMRAAVFQQRQNHSVQNLFLAAVYAVVTLTALILLLWLMRLLFFSLYGRIERWKGTRIPTLRIQQLEILTAEKATRLLIRLARLARFVLSVILLYVATSLILGFFPQTRYLSLLIFDRTVEMVRPLGHALVDYLPNLFVICVILIVGYYALKLTRFFFRSIQFGHISLPGFYPEWADTTYKIARFALIALFVVILFPYLPGSDSPAFRGVSIFVGLLFSLGSTSVVANVVAGLILTYMRPFKVGDRVKIADTVGDIIEKTILVTRVRTIKNVLITVPNAMVLGSHIINYSSSIGAQPLILHTSVTIGYDAPWRKVHELLTAAAARTTHILKEPAPFVLQTSLDDFYVRYELNAYTDKAQEMAVTYSLLHQQIQDTFNAAGVEIMSPHYNSVRDGGETTIPPEQRPSGYRKSPFEVKISPNQ